MVFLDIETTGGSPYDSRITEIGALRVENGEVVGTYSQLLNPGQPVPYFITKLTGISDDMLWDQPAFHGIASDLEHFLRDSIFVAHNVNFDYSFIKEEFKRRGGSFNMDRFCTARLSRQLYPAQRRHNLDTVIEVHGIPVVNRHRALDDATVLHEFYKKALQEHGLQLYAAINKIMVRSNAVTL
jgi:DNA polymerase-3 subunit epsilon